MSVYWYAKCNPCREYVFAFSTHASGNVNGDGSGMLQSFLHRHARFSDRDNPHDIEIVSEANEDIAEFAEWKVEG